MRYAVCVWLFVAAVVIAASVACHLHPPTATVPKSNWPIGPAADNSRCFVCHLNYQQEKVAASHAKIGVGCEKCHGTCDEHCGDENNVTAPSTMYDKEKINPFCLQCHPTLSAIHKPVLAGTFDRKYCTECHGDHRLARRSRVWDKKTGKLLSSDQVPAAPAEKPATPDGMM